MTFELRDTLKGLRRDRAYLATVVLVLALTIGATIAAFSIVNAVLLEPLSYPGSDRLVSVREVWHQLADRMPVVPVNERHFQYWRGRATTLESMAQYWPRSANLTGSGDAAQITIVDTSGSLFDVLQVGAAIGRTLEIDDERADHPQVAVVTDTLWRQRLGSDRSILGRAIVLDGRPYTVVGVLPAGFQLPVRGHLTAKVDAFVPLRPADLQVGWVGEHNNDAIGRLEAGATLEQARAELDVLQAQVSALASNDAHEPVTLASIVTPLTETIVGRARRSLLLLLAAISAVLLIGCFNLANLTLTRTLAQLREAAVRAALGATRGHLVRRLVGEALALAAAGGALGVLVARTAIAAFVWTAPIDLPRASEVAIDGRALFFAVAISLAAGLLVAIVPAWYLATANLQGRLRAGGLSTTDAGGGLRARSVLLTLQIAVSVTLLVVAGLLTLSFARLLESDPGFEPRQTLAIDVVLPLDRYPDSVARARVAERVLERVRAIPGVTAAAWAHILPLTGQGTVNLIAKEGDRRPWSVQPSANYRYVSADFFRALSIPFRLGRTFADSDRDRATVPGIVTERTAANIWPGLNPIGRRFRWTPDPGERLVEVVGVVGDAKTNIDGTPPLMVYMPYWYRPRPAPTLVVHTFAADSAVVAGSVRQAIQAVDLAVAIGTARPMQELVDTALGGRRYQMTLFAAFGAMALLIATVGVYSVTAYGVSRRRREMNVRVALGADPRHVIRMIVRQGFSPIAIGLAAGVGGAFALGGVVASLLFDVRARDPVVVAITVAAVGGIGLLACVLAARRGVVIDPASVLRQE